MSRTLLSILAICVFAGCCYLQVVTTADPGMGPVAARSQP
jgi:hypothetical protein